jgi:hypothetical protein
MPFTIDGLFDPPPESLSRPSIKTETGKSMLLSLQRRSKPFLTEQQPKIKTHLQSERKTYQDQTSALA